MNSLLGRFHWNKLTAPPVVQSAESLPHPVRLSGLLLLLILGTITVYMTGGTGYAYPYVILVPVVLSAAWYGFTGSVIAAVVAGLLLGPLMPLDVQQGIAQSPANWLARLLMFVLIGGFTGSIFRALKQHSDAHAEALRHDSRTGLLNQAALDDDLPVLLRQQARQGRAGLALVFVRIVDLSEILEALGTEASDIVVAAVAARIGDHSKNSVRAYRFSGSELLFLLDTQDSGEVETLVEAIRETGEEVMEVHDVPVRVQMAIGSHHTSDPRTPHQDLIRRARTALFAAVEEAEFYRPYDPAYERKTAERVQLISRVRSGLKSGEFELYFQPKIHLGTGEVCGTEALIRWHGIDGRLIMPDSFMPKVEDTTLIAPVTRFVIQQTTEFLRENPDEQVSINLAVRNLFDKSLIRDLEQIASKAGIEPQRIELEITEGALIKNPYGARVILQELRDQGFPVSLDDFGTGYSSFEYLTHLPITGLKVDRAFVKHLETGESNRSVMKCLVDMAHVLNMTVVAEGIETESQRKILADMGCDMGQGFLFARPMPASRYLTWKAREAV
ncbi:MAG: bifunctional diguanylate cyclase/phosphodiesterase [Natronospirillum sp.]|uniref:putative bifunctional diguanylate cyclase/phosphodiesterase n=1 Tax=Natronospirillum sp. TaxID=2812955 RepID=UPI0025EC2836|nr:bifunctional diguanylate cyclase/phosphodiesterase [Natronospirillum sp.]MCH8552140.1 bifunctional diguanylate cyclase/phosphodiesterase [Natronospirillum sp.]